MQTVIQLANGCNPTNLLDTARFIGVAQNIRMFSNEVKTNMNKNVFKPHHTYYIVHINQN